MKWSRLRSADSVPLMACEYIALRYTVNLHFANFSTDYRDGRSFLACGRLGRRPRNRQIHLHRRARLGIVDAELAAQPAHAFLHSARARAQLFQIELSLAALSCEGRAASAVVSYFHVHVLPVAREFQFYFFAFGMPVDVCQRLLHHRKNRRLDLERLRR